jgi:hypothetical protein
VGIVGFVIYSKDGEQEVEILTCYENGKFNTYMSTFDNRYR